MLPLGWWNLASLRDSIEKIKTRVAAKLAGDEPA
jgi:hypothetical protein